MPPVHLRELVGLREAEALEQPQGVPLFLTLSREERYEFGLELWQRPAAGWPEGTRWWRSQCRTAYIGFGLPLRHDQLGQQGRRPRG
jgi:hypothetical protein